MNENISLDISNLYKDSLKGNRAPTLEQIRKLYSKSLAAMQRLNDLCVSSQVGFLDLPHQMESLQSIELITQKHQNQHITDFVLIGIGGSSLGARFLIQSLQPESSSLKFHFWDNSDPDLAFQILNSINLKKTLFFVVTKSGGTSETISALLVILEKLSEAGVSRAQLKNQIVFATDPKKGDLRAIGSELKIPMLDIPSNIGGRYSVLTGVGLFPAAMAGIDVHSLLKGALSIRSTLITPSFDKNPIMQLGTLLWHHYLELDRDQTVLMPYSSRLKTFTEWFCQLWAESLGKNGTGLTPISAIGATDQHSLLQLFIDGPDNRVCGFIKIEEYNHRYTIVPQFSDLNSFSSVGGKTLNELISSQLIGTQAALAENGRPSFQITLPKLNEHSIGQLILFFETLTPFVGQLLEVDPFNQPGVELSKKLAHQHLKSLTPQRQRRGLN